jgi:hypothetical protein
MTVVHDLASLGTIFGQTHPEDHVIEAQFQGLKHIQTGQTTAMLGNTKVTAELAFQNTVNTSSLLFGAQLASVVRYAVAAAPGACFTMGAGNIAALLEGTLRAEASLPFQK